MKKTIGNGQDDENVLNDLSQDKFDSIIENKTTGEQYNNSLGLSDEGKKNYEEKVNFINSEGFEEMRALQKDDRFLLKDIEKNSKKTEEENSRINKLIIKKILLSKFELTYAKFKLKEKLNDAGGEGLNIIMLECEKNGKKYLEDILEYDKVDNKKLRKCAKIARGETFLFSTNKPGCIRLEVQKTAKNNNIQPLNGQKYYIRRHIDDEADISLMSDILLKGKFFLDYYLTNKKIRYLISSSRLFDDQFNEFWMKERAKEGKFDVPNRIKIREERLNYGGILPDLESEESIEDKFMNGEDNSMTKAFEKYKAQGKELKEGGGYIDLEKLENWKLYK